MPLPWESVGLGLEPMPSRHAILSARPIGLLKYNSNSRFWSWPFVKTMFEAGMTFKTLRTLTLVQAQEKSTLPRARTWSYA